MFEEGCSHQIEVAIAVLFPSQYRLHPSSVVTNFIVANNGHSSMRADRGMISRKTHSTYTIKGKVFQLPPIFEVEGITALAFV